MTDLPTELPNFSTTGRYINQQGVQTESLAKNKGNATTNIGGDTFNINIQAMGKLNEKQLMDMAKDLVKYIQIVKNRDSDATGVLLVEFKRGQFFLMENIVLNSMYL